MSINSKIVALLCAAGIGMGGSTVKAEYDVSELQKLFTDKKQRAQIDAVRSGNYSDAGLQHTSKVKVSGYVTRSDGKSVVWVNGKSTLENARIGDIRVHQSSVGRNKKVTFSVDGKSKQLKPGETWHKEADEVIESY